MIVDLWPRSGRGGQQHARGFEAAIELIEASGDEPFTLTGTWARLRDAWVPGASYSATVAAFDALRALGWITAVSGDGVRGTPTQYVITPGCEPKAVA